MNDLSAREKDYQSAMRTATRGLWSGKNGILAFITQAEQAIEYYFTTAWNEGLGECGIAPSEQTADETARLRLEINTEIGYLWQFGYDIMRGSKLEGGKLTTIFNRLDMWTNKYAKIRALARTYACEDQKLEWVMNPLKEHCRDCLKLNGKVYRQSVWRKYNVYPRMPELECGGYKCGCDLIVTTKPLSRGRPPLGGF
jgi:hypothetical protein